MDWEMIWWCAVVAIALIGFIVAINAPYVEPVSQETIARIENGGRHL